MDSREVGMRQDDVRDEARITRNEVDDAWRQAGRFKQLQNQITAEHR
jgi:hypothetical protein